MTAGLRIGELKDQMRRVDVEGVITSISDARTVRLRTGEEARVADFLLSDDSGSIKLTLWEENIDRVKVGNRVKVENGYTNSFRGELRLNVGRFGSLTVLE